MPLGKCGREEGVPLGKCGREEGESAYESAASFRLPAAAAFRSFST